MFLFSFHAHTLMRDLKTLFVFVVFFFLGLKNFISPLFCWTVAKKKPPHIHQYLCEWIALMMDAERTHRIWCKISQCIVLTKILRSMCGWHVLYTSTYWFRSMCWHGSLFSRQKKNYSCFFNIWNHYL